MFPDPISVRVGDTPTNHARIGVSDNVGTFYAETSSPDRKQTVTVKQNQTSNRFRREFRVSRSAPFTNPLTGLTTQEGASVYLVIDEPKSGGFADSELNDMANSLIEFFDDANESNLFKLLSGEY